MRINYNNFKESFAPFLCFSLKDVRKEYPEFDRKRLTEWQIKGYLQKIVREYYMFNDVNKDTSLLWYLANSIFEPSYISMQSALNYYGFIPEAVFQVTSISTKRTRNLDALDVRFTYRNIKRICFFGYNLLPFREEHFIQIAEPEKALLDMLYLETSLDGVDAFEGWRFNKSVIKKSVNMSLMDQYAILMKNNSFYRRFIRFKNWLNA